MANKKISQLDALGTAPAGADILPITDVSGTPTTKSVTVANLHSGLQAEPSEGAFVDGDKTKLDGIEASADVTDATNVQAAGALMDSEVTNLAQVKAFDSSDYSPAFFSTVTESTTARTLSDSDNGKVIICTNAVTTNITIPSTLSAGFSCTLVQNGASSVIAGAGSGVTLNAIGGKYATEGQYAAMRIIPVGTNSYVLSGSLAEPPYSNTYSLDFDGTNDYIEGTGSTLTVGTVSCWFYNDIAISSTTQAQVVFSQGASDFGIVLGGPQIAYVTDELIGIQYNSSNFAYTSAVDTISVGWHHVMIAWVSNSSTNSGSPGYDIWLDGNKVGNDSGSSGTITSSPDTLSSAGFYLGARGGTYRLFNGRIDEFALWTGDVSGDLANIYNGGNGAVDLSDSAVVGTAPNIWWRMGDNDGGSGTTITDQGSASVNGSINGATIVTDTP